MAIIELDYARTIKLNMIAIDNIEKKLNKPITKMDIDTMTQANVALILSEGMRHEDDEMSPKKVMKLISRYSTPGEAMRVMGEAMNEAFGSDDEPNESDDEEENEGKEKNE